MNIQDFELQIQQAINKSKQKVGQSTSRMSHADELSVANQNAIGNKDISLAICLDLKLYTQRFMEYISNTTNFIEIHNYV